MSNVRIVFPPPAPKTGIVSVLLACIVVVVPVSQMVVVPAYGVVFMLGTWHRREITTREPKKKGKKGPKKGRSRKKGGGPNDR